MFRITSMTLSYQNFIILLAALLNSIAGLVIDFYAPCLPIIAIELHTSAAVMQNTITIAVIGYAVGQLVFGILCDKYGRKISICTGLSLFIAGSSLGVISNSITMLMLGRIIQGFAAGSCQVIARALIIDHVSGKKFSIAVVYLSTAFATGLIVGPFFDAYIQQALNWQWNFVIYALYSTVLLLVVMFGLRWDTAKKINVVSSYRDIFTNTAFIMYFIQLGCCFIAFTIWNQVGSFVVHNQLHRSIGFFGYSALIIGVCYLLGTIINRTLIAYSTNAQRILLSHILAIIGIIMLCGSHLNISVPIMGLSLIGLAQGIVFTK